MKRVCFAAFALLGVCLSASARADTFAYSVPTGTAGTQAFGGSLGMDFDVLSDIEVFSLGAFDDLSNGLNLPINVQLFNRATQTSISPILTLSGGGDPLIGGHRFADLTTPITLSAGFQGTIVAWNYGAAERNGNVGTGSAASSPDGGAGLVSFVGSGRFNATPGAFPTSVDGGPASRYSAGTFRFKAPNEITLDPSAASATFSQTGFPASAAIDGLGTTRGWAIAPNTGTDQAAVFPTAMTESVGSFGSFFTVTLGHEDPALLHTLGKFRVSATDDAAPSLASTWTTLTPIAADGLNAGTTFTFEPDGSILVGGTLLNNDIYTIDFERFIGLDDVTAFRLEALADPSLPSNGPGRASNGNFVVSTFRVSQVAATPEPASILIWSILGVFGLVVFWRRRVAN